MKMLAAALMVVLIGVLTALMAIASVNMDLMELIEKGKTEMTELRKEDARTRSELMKVRDEYQACKRALETTEAERDILEAELESAMLALNETFVQPLPKESTPFIPPKLYSPAFIHIGYRLLLK